MGLSLYHDLDMAKILCFTDRNFYMKKICRRTTFPFFSQEIKFPEKHVMPKLSKCEKYVTLK